MRVLAVLGTAFAATLVTAAPSSADDVQVLHGTGFPTPDTHLTYVGCETFHGPVAAPQLRINRGPETAPMGARSFGLVPAGAGTAAGALVRLASMATGTSALEVHATDGTTGVSWAWVRAADVPGDQAWLGRAPVSVPAGGWHRIDSAALAYTWTLMDLRTGVEVGSEPAQTLAGFTAAHGDGEGYVVTGLGCDGRSFNVDGVRGGAAGSVTTYDLEGMSLSTTIAASVSSASPGDEVELTATVVDVTGRPTGDLVVLESRSPGGKWRVQGDQVSADAEGVARATVAPEATTEYRWFRPESEYADAGWSDPVLVTVTG